MVFSTDDRVLIKVLRQEKGYGAKNSSQNFPASQIWGKLQERVYRSRIHDVKQLKCTPDRRVGTEGILNTHTLVMFDICTDVHFESHMSVRLPIVDTFV